MYTITAETRRATPGDATTISLVHSESWQHAYSGIIPHGALTRMIHRRDANWWATAIRRSTLILVIEVDDVVAGYATIGPNRVSTFPHEGEIYEIYLKPEYQGIGLGTTLFAEAKNELKRRGYNGFVVWVLADNDPAVRFYSNAGGRAIATGSEHFDQQKLQKIAYAWE